MVFILILLSYQAFLSQPYSKALPAPSSAQLPAMDHLVCNGSDIFSQPKGARLPAAVETGQPSDAEMKWGLRDPRI